MNKNNYFDYDSSDNTLNHIIKKNSSMNQFGFIIIMVIIIIMTNIIKMII